MKAVLGLCLVCATSTVFATDIPFLSGKATPLRGGARTPVRIDPIQADFLEGKLDTSKWDDVSTTADKPFSGRAFNSGYAYFEVNSSEDKSMFLEAKGHTMVYVNGAPRVGDIYSFGYVSLPVHLHKGKNTFLFAVARGEFSGKLADAPKPISFNPGDQTTPDIVKGEKEKLWVAFIVRNATGKDLDDLTINAGGVTTKVPRVMAMSIRKVGFLVNPNKDGKYTVTLKQGRQTLDSLPLTLRIRNPHQSHKRTFVSKIDGSIQYYAVQPSTHDGAGQALFLSLHGASVEAMGQADAYEPKSWGYIVCPTNRRPYGFDWEDIGREDALEVLELAKKRYQTDPSKTYLTGHSMGGHGTYHLGVLYPDKFAAVAPCSGWVSFFSYANGATYPDTPVGNVLKRASSASDTLSMKTNFYSRPIFIMHGAADDNVPVSEARNMRKELADDPLVFWHEEPGAGHWYDTDDEPGAGCEDYAPIFDMFARTRLPQVNEVRSIDFKTPNLAVSNKDFWLTITAQDEAGSISSVKATVFPGLRKYVVTCSNVAAFKLDLSPLYGKGKITVVVNDKEVSTTEAADGEIEVDLDPKANADQTICTGFKSVFNNHITFVIPTGGSKAVQEWARNKARFDAEQLEYIGNGSVDVITDTEYFKNEKVYGERNLIVYGDEIGNGLYLMIHGSTRSGVSTQGIRFEARAMKNRVVASITASANLDCRLADRVPLFTAGASIPDYLVLENSYLRSGLSGVVTTGFQTDK
ncbi:MAG: prolyl oligopeptidase family serine peptidase [Armatimonadetes bacterium]|nr:prolyl oligopeptidase family serine peptidase [Armatimonadota bacterium]